MEPLVILAALVVVFFFGDKLPNVLWILVAIVIIAIPCQSLIFLVLVIISDHTPLADLFPGL